MIVVGIDPGYAIVGWGAVRSECARLTVLDCGAITTPPDWEFGARLEHIYDELEQLLARLKPDAVAVEQLFFNTNTTTAIGVAEARGCILLATQKSGASVFEYTPLQVKQSVTGYGKAQKAQVMEMTRLLLNLPTLPRPDDVADALAVAICHSHSAGSRLSGLMKAAPANRPAYLKTARNTRSGKA